MPRGKNYVNNNRGVTMQASAKKKAPTMEQCFYGSGCTRANCFYRHDAPAAGVEKSNEPCMPFLAGMCTFSASGCKKRHPPKEEKERLVAKYKSRKCRYGKHCKTTGCLYLHEDGSNGADGNLAGPGAFPPLAGSNAAIRPMAPAGAWRPMQPTGATMAGPTPAASVQPAISAWKPSPPPAPAATVWGKGANPVLANHGSPSPVNGMNSKTNGVVAAPASPRTSESSLLNINAKEFVPGNF
jgi:Ataxin-2 C-terminal region